MLLNDGLDQLENQLTKLAEGKAACRKMASMRMRLHRVQRLIVTDGWDILGELPVVFPSPNDLVEEVVLHARDNAVDWGAHEADYPNDFSITVPRGAWEAYYGIVDRAAERIAASASSLMEDITGVRGWNPRVSCVCDDLLARGEFNIECRFTNERVASHYMQDSLELDPQEEGEVVEEATTRIEDYVAQLEEDMTPEVLDRVCLRFIGGMYDIHSGAAVGVRRTNRHEQPNVALPLCEHTRYVSCRHLVFELNADGSWIVTQYGKNATRLVTNDGEETVLRTGDSHVIRNHDRIYFSRSSVPAVFVVPDEDLPDDGTLLWPESDC